MIIRDLSSAPVDVVVSIGHLLDHDVHAEAAARFAHEPGHHLLVAYDGDLAVGFVTGVQLTHPDKGTEMFLYELGVDPSARRRGVGRALVDALADVARAAGCYGMWVLTDRDNEAAMRTYTGAGGADVETTTMISWQFDQSAPTPPER